MPLCYRPAQPRLRLAVAVALLLPRVAEACSIVEDDCPGGVFVEGECWRIGNEGESCVDVCGMAEMVDEEGTIA